MVSGDKDNPCVLTIYSADYCNSLVCGMIEQNFVHLSGCIVLRALWSANALDLLQELHWLPITHFQG